MCQRLYILMLSVARNPSEVKHSELKQTVPGFELDRKKQPFKTETELDLPHWETTNYLTFNFLEGQ